MTKHFPIEFSVSAGACIWGCLLILLAPLNLLTAFYAAAAIHELCHILTLYYFHIPVSGISFGISGAAIRTGPLPPKQELICTMAGPVGSFLCVFLFRIFPLVALSGFIQGIYNLLPVYPMDGGRILRCLCLCLCPERSEFICSAAKMITITLIAGLCVLLHFRTSDSFYLVIALYFLLQTCAKRKIPCKEHQY